MAIIVENAPELTEERIAEVRAELVETDGEPLESPWHRSAINLLLAGIRCHLRDRTDYFAGGNMFIYFSLRQARTRSYRGPDFFFVKGVDGTRPREIWWVFEEDSRYPDVIVELQSRSTAEEDLTTKKEIYRTVFQTSEYFCYDPYEQRLLGWRLVKGEYEPIPPNERGWLWSEQMELWLGTWEGSYLLEHASWLRFYDRDGNLVLIEEELERRRAEDEKRRADTEQRRAEDEKRRADTEQRRAEDEKRRADTEQRRAEDEKRRADSLEEELQRLRARLAEQSPPSAPPEAAK